MVKLREFAQAYVDIVGKKPECEADDGRLAAAHQVARTSALFKEWGYRVGIWRPGPGTPGGQREGSRGMYCWSWGPATEGWLDHPYRIIRPDKTAPVFVSEPYQITEKGLVNLAMLSKDWLVRTMPVFALHFPGRTIPIWIERRRNP